MKNNTFMKLRQLDRKYDYSDYDTQGGKKYTKHRSHKRSRQQLKIIDIRNNLDKVI